MTPPKSCTAARISIVLGFYTFANPITTKKVTKNTTIEIRITLRFIAVPFRINSVSGPDN